ncbi:MAG: hypothetical protein GWM98_02935, partial [Nitrospinaceae bacterium]|nr:hypothetical protein [Nitrospinaceae bacterium]NIR53653.1 hypothetical protein [Nitrospinaceae bacterium]NIS84059.1 hypothetical protein [Nitrospinaceae bacterium]NIT80860.1 hypothetical protein [Nitrospinaceae bacterium]NIU43169.1 hypothetical protein [Nitrospinaceae bacterium]
ETLQKIIEVIKNKMRIDACAIYLLDEDGNHLNLKASSGMPPEASTKIQLKMGKGVTGW